MLIEYLLKLDMKDPVIAAGRMDGATTRMRRTKNTLTDFAEGLIR